MSNSQVVNKIAFGTMPCSDKGIVTPAPELEGPIAVVAKAVTSWSGISTTSHWHFYDRSRVDGVDFYLGDEKLGHIHFDGALHLASGPSLGKAFIAAGLARRFPYQYGWVCEDVNEVGVEAATALSKRNYERLQLVTT